MQDGRAVGARQSILQCCKGFSGFSQDCKKNAAQVGGA
jgi:hypothetical protein